MVDVLNVVGCDYVCLGNHEADVGNVALKQRIQQSQFTWIHSNLPQFAQHLQLLDDDDNDNSNHNNHNVKTHEILQVGNRQVVLLGFLTDDPALYRPTSFGGSNILPIAPSLEEWKHRLLQSSSPSSSSSSPVDLILPMTHQSIQEDRTLAEAMAMIHVKDKKTQNIPLILGGHDHEIFLESVEGIQIVKTGMDAKHVAVIDIMWNDNDDNDDIKTSTILPPPTVTVTMVDTLDFEPDPDIQQRVQGHKSILRELETAKLFKISDWLPPNHNDNDNKNNDNDNDSGTAVFSTHNNRLGPSTGTTALCSMLRMGLRCQVALLNAGCVRANKDYPRDTYFTWSDLKAELVYSTKMVVANLPGKVLQETLQYSRRFAKEGIAFGGYLHTSRTTILSEDDDDTTIKSIMGEPFDPERNYLTAFPYVLLEGLDDQKPLLEWAATPEAQPYLPSHHTAIPAKIVLVECMAALFWLQYTRSFQDMAQEDGKIGPDDVRQKMRDLYGNQNDVAADLMADSVFLLADRDGDGTISAMEQMIVRFVAMDMMNHIVTEEELQILRTIASQVLESDENDHDTLDRVVQEIRAALDLKGTGSIQREEILQALGQVAGKDFLQ